MCPGARRGAGPLFQVKSRPQPESETIPGHAPEDSRRREAVTPAFLEYCSPPIIDKVFDQICS
jgi:hypothetical protein